MPVLAGCGGGGGNTGTPSTPTPAPSVAVSSVVPRLVLTWGARSRASQTLSSALSARVRLLGAGLSGEDVVFMVDRSSAPSAYTNTYLAPVPIRLTPFNLDVTFYAQPGGAGDSVGRASGTVQAQADGLLPAVTVQATIASVEVAPTQTAYVGEKSDVAFTCKDQNGSLVAVSPGSAFVTLVSGSVLRPQGSQIEGVAPGQAQITASVDGVQSVPQTVAVTSRAVVSIAPSAPHIAVNGSLALSATVDQLPTTATKDVVWQVADANSGSITPDGHYTAPANPGTYVITASSVYDPAKRATVTVTVEAGSTSVGADFPTSGGVEVGID